jgi:hypothetical protein
MIVKNGKIINSYYYGKTPIMEIYRGKFLIWEAIRSCFGSGYWIPSSLWESDSIWRNN